MIYYRLYQLCGPRNKVESFREFEADGDSIAIALVETWRGLNPWNSGPVIAKSAAGKQSSPAAELSYRIDPAS